MVFARRIKFDDLAVSDGGEQSPQPFAIMQVGKPTPIGSSAETIQRTERHIFLIFHAARDIGQLLTRESDEVGEIAVPEPTSCVVVSLFDLFQPDRDRMAVHAVLPQGPIPLSVGGSPRVCKAESILISPDLAFFK